MQSLQGMKYACQLYMVMLSNTFVVKMLRICWADKQWKTLKIIESSCKMYITYIQKQ